MKSTLIRVNIVGYAGQPVSVFAAFDPETDILAVANVRDIEHAERDGFLRIANSAHEKWFDALFTEDKLRDAVVAFFELTSLGLLSIDTRAQRANPAAKIEPDGMDERGTKYRLAPDIGPAQVAVLAACWYAGQQRGLRDAMDFAGELEEMFTTI